jgi:hypothetical protein
MFLRKHQAAGRDRAEGEDKPIISSWDSPNHDTLAWDVLTHFNRDVANRPAALFGAARKIYFRELLIESNLVLRLVPRPLTTAMIASEMPAAINPYSMAVAPLWSRQNLKTKLFIVSCPQLSLGTEGLHARSGYLIYLSKSMFGLIWASKSFRDFSKLLASSNAIKQDEIARQLRAPEAALHRQSPTESADRQGLVPLIP